MAEWKPYTVDQETVDAHKNIRNQCLDKVLELLKKETVPTAATAKTVKRLIETALSIDLFLLKIRC